MVGERYPQAGEEAANERAVYEMLNGVFGSMAKNTILGISVASKGCHSSSCWPGIEKELNKYDEGGRFHFVMGKLNTVSDAVYSVADWDFKLE